MFNEFIFADLIRAIETLGVKVTAFRSIHTSHMSIVVEPYEQTNILDYTLLIRDIIMGYGLMTTHVAYNESEDSYLFECIRVFTIGCN